MQKDKMVYNNQKYSEERSKKLNNITVFIDESGTIGKGTIKSRDYFIVTLLLVRDENIDHIKKVFKKERLKVVNKKIALKERLKKNKEVKGSELSETEKKPIYDKIVEKCGDKFEIAIILLDNQKATVKFRSNSSRAFNYLIKTFLQTHFKKRSRYRDVNQMHFIIDERNVATESKFTLQEYLNTELNLMEVFSHEDIMVHYCDSKNYILLQLTDFISNTFYRYWQKNNKEAKENVDLLIKQTSTNKEFRFPYHHGKKGI